MHADHGEGFFLGEIMELMPALNYDDQIIKLRDNHNLTIKDDEFAKKFYKK